MKGWIAFLGLWKGKASCNSQKVAHGSHLEEQLQAKIVAAAVAAFPWNRFFGREPLITHYFGQMTEEFDPEWTFTLASPAVLGHKAALADPNSPSIACSL